MTKQTDRFLHYREGKTQSQRFLNELDPKSFQLNDLDVADWLLFAFNFAQHLNYFEKETPEISTSNWQDFFAYFGIKEIILRETGQTNEDIVQIPRREEIAYKEVHKNIQQRLAEYEQDGSLTPHLVLFIAFLKILEYSKGRFNELTKRHLDFYYKDILKIEKKKPVADSAYVIFELAKKASQEKIPEGTVLDGKKDNNGKKRLYKVSEDLIANQAQVVEIKSFLKDNDQKELKIAPITNSLDGLGAEFNEDVKYWWPFGYNSKEPNYPELPNAELGFSIASPVLDLKSGEREVTVDIVYDNNYKGTINLLEDKEISDVSGLLEIIAILGRDELSSEDLEKVDDYLEAMDAIKNSIQIVYSGEKDWVLGADIIQSIISTENILRFKLVFPADFPGIVHYNSKVHKGNYSTQQPMLRFLIKGDRSYDLYTQLADKKIKTINITALVKGFMDVTLENDNGIINEQKPFYPFTAQPIKGANFTLNSDEIFSKKWNTLYVSITWKNTPDSFVNNYKGYINTSDSRFTKQYFDTTNNTLANIVTTDSFFEADVFLRKLEKWEIQKKIPLFNRKIGSTYQTVFSISNSNIGSISSDGLRLTLKDSFLQEIYATIYSLTITGKRTDLPIPLPPYIPLVESIEVSYIASDQISNSVTNNESELFLEDVFGFIKEDKVTNIVPVHLSNAELYMGISANPGQQVSLFIQNVEGSENPETEPFSDNEKIKWEILSGNQWNDLSENIIKNETQNLLQSGIIKFGIPIHTDLNNTLLDPDLVWVRASMNKSYDAVSKTQGIYAQAVVAVFEDNDNELSHLEEGLPANTIDKLQTRIAKIKKIQQPYNTLGGVPEESDLGYYRRVSERLRHKNRAITQWDYEQLILQEFPDIFKVKCLNHTSKSSFMAPGYVTLIVVPGTANKNIFDIYQPRVSKATLANVEEYINRLNSLQVDAIVMSPEYQEIKVEVSVKFYSQYDESFYSKQLDEDIKKYLSPWAFSSTAEVSFDVALNRYHLLDYLERLYYVDFIDNLKIFTPQNQQVAEENKEWEELKVLLIKANPKSILVSAKKHLVNITTHKCSEIEETIVAKA